MGGCSTPISAFAEVRDGQVHFKGNILSPDGHQIAESSSIKPIKDAGDSDFIGAKNILVNGGQAIIDKMKNVTK